jgi:hypothetical protein
MTDHVSHEEDVQTVRRQAVDGIPAGTNSLLECCHSLASLRGTSMWMGGIQAEIDVLPI